MMRHVSYWLGMQCPVRHILRYLFIFGLLCGPVFGATNLLNNPSFEGGSVTNYDAAYWGSAYDHAGRWGSARRHQWRTHEGNYAYAIAGQYDFDGCGRGGVWQEAACVAGEEFRFRSWFWSDDGGAGTWTSLFQEIKIEFYNASGEMLSSTATNIGFIGESWTLKTISAIAPANCAWVRSVIMVEGAGYSGSLQFDELELSKWQGSTWSTNHLLNGGFEDDGDILTVRPSYWEMWNPDNNGASWGRAGMQEWRAHEGSHEMVILNMSVWLLDAHTSGGIWQQVPGVPDRAYTFSAWFWADDGSYGDWTADTQEIKLEFYDAGLNFLGSAVQPLGHVGENWERRSVTATAPAYTAWTRAIVAAYGLGYSGALQFDDLELVIETNAAVPEIIGISVPGAITLGNSSNITVTVRNSGGDGFGGISVSMPAFANSQDTNQVTNSGSTMAYSEYPQGEMITDKTGGTFAASHMLVEGFDGNWSSGETNKLSFLVEPVNAGNFELRIRSTLQKGDEKHTTPLSGPIDQQGWWVTTRSIDVEDPTVPKIVGTTLNATINNDKYQLKAGITYDATVTVEAGTVSYNTRVEGNCLSNQVGLEPIHLDKIINQYSGNHVFHFGVTVSAPGDYPVRFQLRDNGTSNVVDRDEGVMTHVIQPLSPTITCTSVDAPIVSDAYEVIAGEVHKISVNVSAGEIVHWYRLELNDMWELPQRLNIQALDYTSLPGQTNNEDILIGPTSSLHTLVVPLQVCITGLYQVGFQLRDSPCNGSGNVFVRDNGVALRCKSAPNRFEIHAVRYDNGADISGVSISDECIYRGITDAAGIWSLNSDPCNQHLILNHPSFWPYHIVNCPTDMTGLRLTCRLVPRDDELSAFHVSYKTYQDWRDSVSTIFHAVEVDKRFCEIHTVGAEVVSFQQHPYFETCSQLVSRVGALIAVNGGYFTYPDSYPPGAESHAEGYLYPTPDPEYDTYSSSTVAPVYGVGHKLYGDLARIQMMPSNYNDEAWGAIGSVPIVDNNPEDGESDFDHAIQSGPVLILDGVVNSALTGAPHWTYPWSRTAIGVSEVGNTILVVADSAGCHGGRGSSYNKTAFFMRDYMNAQYAMSLDGGGSSQICIQQYGVPVLLNGMASEFIKAYVDIGKQPNGRVHNYIAVFKREDSDDDGMPDDWEIEKLGSLTASDGSIDSDSDGVLDKDEFLCATDPENSSEYPHIDDAVVNGGNSSRVSFSTQLGRSYRIQSATDCQSSNWINHGWIEGRGGSTQQYLNMTSPSGAYRFECR